MRCLKKQFWLPPVTQTYPNSLYTILHVRKHNSITPTAPYHTTLLSATEKTSQWQNQMELCNPLQPSVNGIYQVLEYFSTLMHLYRSSQQSCPLTPRNSSALGRACRQSCRRWDREWGVLPSCCHCQRECFPLSRQTTEATGRKFHLKASSRGRGAAPSKQTHGRLQKWRITGFGAWQKIYIKQENLFFLGNSCFTRKTNGQINGC